MGKKYIIEIEDGKEGIILCQKGIVTVGLHLENESELKPLGIQSAIPYTEPDLEQVRKEGYKEGREAGIKDGKCEAWEAARKIWKYDTTTLRAIFGEGIMRMDWFMNITASEAIEKLKAYEQERDAEIKVWDEICCIANPDIKVCVTNIEDGYFSGFTIKHPDRSNIGEVYSHRNIVGWEKTGGYFSEIATILEKMRGE